MHDGMLPRTQRMEGVRNGVRHDDVVSYEGDGEAFTEQDSWPIWFVKCSNARFQRGWSDEDHVQRDIVFRGKMFGC